MITPQSIIDRLNEIQEWINKNGFGNRGYRHVCDDVHDLENAMSIVFTASETLNKWEDTYRFFYLEKTVSEHPEFAQKWEKLWYPIKMGWVRKGQDLDFLYNRAVEYNGKFKKG